MELKGVEGKESGLGRAGLGRKLRLKLGLRRAGGQGFECPNLQYGSDFYLAKVQ